MIQIALMEFSSRPNYEHDQTQRLRQVPLGSTALQFYGPERETVPYGTQITVIDDPELIDDKTEEVEVSYASSREDFQLLRRHKQQMRNRAKRARRKR